LLIAVGLHPPWNWGEAVATRNIIMALKRIGVEPVVYSMLNRNRFEGRVLPGVHYICANDVWSFTLESLNHMLRSGILEDVLALHVAGAKDILVYPIAVFKRIVGRTRLNLPIFVHNYGETPVSKMGMRRFISGSGIGNIQMNFGARIITTSIVQYLRLKILDKVFYTPVPVYLGEDGEASAEKKLIDLSCIIDFEISKDDFPILYLGHLRPTRFPYTLVLKAVYRLLKLGYDNIRLVIVAPENKKNFEHAKQVELLSNALGLSRYVCVKVKNLSEKAKIALLQRSKVFLFLATKPESMDPPISVLEAMAHGSIVVATPYQSLPFMIRTQLNGILLENLEQEQLVRAMELVLKKEPLQEMISVLAKETIKTRFSIDAASKALKRVYDDVLGKDL